MADVPLRRIRTSRAVWVFRIFFLVAVAFIFGLIANQAGWLPMLHEPPKPSPTRKAWVAKGNIAASKTVVEDDIREAEVKLEDLPPQYLSEKKDIIHRTALVGVEDGRPFTKEMLGPLETPLVLKDGHVVVKLDPSRADGPLNLLKPGSLVALYAQDGSIVSQEAVIQSPQDLTLQLRANETARFMQETAGRIRLVLLGRNAVLTLPEAAKPSAELEKPILIIRGGVPTFQMPFSESAQGKSGSTPEKVAAERELSEKTRELDRIKERIGAASKKPDSPERTRELKQLDEESISAETRIEFLQKILKE